MHAQLSGGVKGSTIVLGKIIPSTVFIHLGTLWNYVASSRYTLLGNPIK